MTQIHDHDRVIPTPSDRGSSGKYAHFDVLGVLERTWGLKSSFVGEALCFSSQRCLPQH